MMYVNKWWTLTSGCFVLASAGLAYCFSVFAPALKDVFGFHETQIDSVGSAFNFGGYLAVAAGVVYDRLQSKPGLGPRVVLWIGASLLSIGYYGLYACAKGYTAASYLKVLMFAFIAGNSSTWLDTAGLVTNVHNFPFERGTVVGISKSFIGLSASIYSSIYAAVYEPDAIGFLLFLAVVPSLLVFIASIAVNITPSHPHSPPCGYLHVQPEQQYMPVDEPSANDSTVKRPNTDSSLVTTRDVTSQLTTKARFAIMYLLVGSTALYQMATGLYAGTHHLQHSSRIIFTAGLLAILSLFLLVPLGSGSCLFSFRGSHCVHGSHRPKQEGIINSSDNKGLRSPQYYMQAETEPLLSSLPTSSTSSPAQGRMTAQQSNSQMSTDAASSDHQEITIPHTTLPLQNAFPSPGSVPGLPLPPQQVQPSQSHHTNNINPVSLSPLQAASTLQFWLLFLQFSVGVGTGLVFLNNLGGLVLSLGGDKGGQVPLVSLFSVANAAGRLLFGYLSEHYLQSHGMQRTFFLMISSSIMLGLALLSQWATLSDLYALALLAGLGFGAHWSLIPAIAADMFGLVHFAANYTMLQLAPAVGGYSLATWLAGKLYEQAAVKHHDGLYCLGADCYSQTWRVLLLLNSAALLGTWALHVHTGQLAQP